MKAHQLLFYQGEQAQKQKGGPRGCSRERESRNKDAQTWLKLGTAKCTEDRSSLEALYSASQNKLLEYAKGGRTFLPAPLFHGLKCHPINSLQISQLHGVALQHKLDAPCLAANKLVQEVRSPQGAAGGCCRIVPDEVGQGLSSAARCHGGWDKTTETSST